MQLRHSPKPKPLSIWIPQGAEDAAAHVLHPSLSSPLSAFFPWGFGVTSFISEATLWLLPVTSSASGVCAGGRAQLCISRAFSGGSLAMGMNSPRSRRRPPHRVQRPFCSPREAKTTHSQINREQTTQTLPRRGGRGGTHIPDAGHLAPGTTRGHSVLQQGARGCKINLGFDCPMLCCNSDVAKGNGNQCGLPPNSGAPLSRVNISIKAPGSRVSAVMERAPLFIL